jgi:crotonobetainyl-CoA:carnitine CoA-transferase CaiB-like acyl-CoA transferase
MVARTDAPRLLHGLRAIETSGATGVRYCGRLLAAMGAEVIRIPSEDHTVATCGGDADRAYALWLDERKGTAASLEAALAAAGDAGDVLVLAGQTPSAVRAVDARLAALGSGATRVGLTWFGDEGPYADWQGTDEIVHALIGMAFSFGLPDGPPTFPQGHGPQLIAGVDAIIGGLAALMAGLARPRRVDVTVLEAALCFTEVVAVTAAMDPAVKSQREGVNRYSPVYPSTVYPSADGHVGIMALTPAQWAGLCALVGRPELAGDPRFATSAQRTLLADEIDAILGPPLASAPTDHWVEAGVRHRVPITPSPRPADLPRHSHWAGRASFAALDGTDVVAPTLPYRFRFDGVVGNRPQGGARGPLTGVRVADFSMGWAGPLAARYLSDLGAEVLKVESSGRPDWWRGWEIVEDQDPPAHELPKHFLAVNRGKKGLDLDLNDPRHKAAAQAIISHADVVIENQGPGVMEKLGLGQAEQRRLRPGIISICMPPFGLGGPLGGLRAYGSTVEQASGLPFVNGHEQWTPAQQHAAFGDPVAGVFTAAVAMAALYGRPNVGGSEIESCQVECLFQLNADGIIADQLGGVRRVGSRRRAAAPVCIVPSAGEDAWLAIVVRDDAAWRGLCGLVGDPTLDPSWTIAERQACEDAIEAALAAWSRHLAPSEAARRLQKAGVAAAPVSPAHALCEDPHLEVAAYWARLERRYVGTHVVTQTPLRFDGVRPEMTQPAPVLGEHMSLVVPALEDGAAPIRPWPGAGMSVEAG